jgi:hypothetical protein
MYKTDNIVQWSTTLQDFKIEDTTLEEMQSGEVLLKGYTIQ